MARKAEKALRTEVVIVGAGPIGIQAAAVLKRVAVDYLHFEAGQVGQTLTRWPRETQFFSSPEWIALAGIPIQTRDQGMINVETYLAYLRSLVEIFDLDIRTYHRVSQLQAAGDGSPGFELLVESNTGSQKVRAKYVILAVGDMARPRMLGVPGEDLPNVSHQVLDPHSYFQKHLMIVGGRNSAIEMAIRAWRIGARPMISYRKPDLDKDSLISRLYLDLRLMIEHGQVDFYPGTEIIEFKPGSIVLGPARDLEPGYPGKASSQIPGAKPVPTGTIELAADFSFVATGYLPDQSLLEMAGVSFRGPMRQPVYDPRSMETDVPGIFVTGTARAGEQTRHKVFIASCMDEIQRILARIRPDLHEAYAARLPAWIGNHPQRHFPVGPQDLA